MKTFMHVCILSLLTCSAFSPHTSQARRNRFLRRNAVNNTSLNQPASIAPTATATPPESRPEYPGSRTQHNASNQQPTRTPHNNAHDIVEPTSIDMEKRGVIQAHEVKALLNVDDAAAQEIAQCMNNCRQVLSSPLNNAPDAEAQKAQEITDAMNKSRSTIKQHVSKGDETYWDEVKDDTWKKLYPSIK